MGRGGHERLVVLGLWRRWGEESRGARGGRERHCSCCGSVLIVVLVVLVVADGAGPGPLVAVVPHSLLASELAERVELWCREEPHGG